jgi:hypothetical protein
MDYVNAMKEAAGSGNWQLSVKIMTQYHSYIVTGKKPQAKFLGRKRKIKNDGVDVEATKELKRIRQEKVPHS